MATLDVGRVRGGRVSKRDLASPAPAEIIPPITARRVDRDPGSGSYSVHHYHIRSPLQGDNQERFPKQRGTDQVTSSTRLA